MVVRTSSFIIVLYFTVFKMMYCIFLQSREAKYFTVREYKRQKFCISHKVSFQSPLDLVANIRLRERLLIMSYPQLNPVPKLLELSTGIFDAGTPIFKSTLHYSLMFLGVCALLAVPWELTRMFRNRMKVGQEGL